MIEWIDSSGLATYAECPRKFLYSSRRVISPSPHLSVGGSVASALDTWRTHLLSGTAPPTAFERAVQRLAETFPHETPWKEKTFHNTALALSLYCREFLNSPYQVVRSEFSFSLPLPDIDPPVLFSGRIDALVRNGPYYLILDDKTTSQLGPQWPHQWRLHGQFIGYLWALSELLEDAPLGVLCRGLRISNNPQVVECGPFLFSPHLIKEWLEAAILRVRMIQSGTFPPVYSNHVCRFCPWQDICTLSPQQREDTLSELPTNDWNPINATLDSPLWTAWNGQDVQLADHPAGNSHIHPVS